MRWEKPLFVHLAVPRATVEARLPASLTLDPEAGETTVSLVALGCVGPAPRLIERTPLSFLARYRQLNVRTYVQGPHGRGLWFFDARVDRIAATAPRLLGQPYRRDGKLAYEADDHAVAVRARGIRVKGLPAPDAPEELDRTSPVGALLERYLSYGSLAGLLYVVRVGHPHWRVRHVEIDPDSRIDLGDLGTGRVLGAQLAETVDVTIDEVKPAGAVTGLRSLVGRAALGLVMATP
jgi:uncharacterized protein YqjF (DUF2071 family)